jgi:hypothetical protein
MSHGGARPNAGRPKGAANRITEEVRRRALRDGGEMPLEFMLRVMRTPAGKCLDEEQPPEGQEPKGKVITTSLRMEMAKAAARYVHAKLASVLLPCIN